jgi:hypothetical protein
MSIDWSEYARVHASRANLLIHLFAVPFFIASLVSLIKYVLHGDWVSVVIVIIFAIFAMVLQGRGHKKELVPPRPFTGPANFLRRWFTEQLVIFPLFFLSGRWWRQYQDAEVRHEP